MLYRDILVLHVLGLILGRVERAIQLRGYVHLFRLPAARHLGQLAYFPVQGGVEGVLILAHSGDELGYELLVEQRLHKVLLIHLLVGVAAGDGLGILHRRNRFLR